MNQILLSSIPRASPWGFGMEHSCLETEAATIVEDNGYLYSFYIDNVFSGYVDNYDYYVIL